MKNYTEENRIRPDILTAGVYWAIIIIMIYNIIAYRFYGDKGAFFAAGPLWLYGIFYSIFVLGVQKSVYIMVRLRARRSQYLNAETNMERSLRLFGAVGVILGILLLALGFTFSKYLLGSSRGTFQCILVALSLFLLCSQGVLRGYLQGLNYTKPIIISDLLIAAVTVVFGTILSKALYDYGVKVNGLFHVDDFSAVYGSCGMLMGFFAGSLAGLIQIGVSFFLRKSEISDFVKTGAPRYLDNKNDVLTGIRAIALLYVTPALMMLLDECVYIFITGKKHPDVDFYTNYGMYFAKAIIPTFLFAFLCCVPFIKSWNRVMARIERDELEGAAERFKSLFRRSAMLIIPVMIFVFILAETLQTSTFGKSTKLSIGMAQLSSLMITLLAVAVFISWLMNHMGKSLVLVVNLGILWALHVAGLVLFMMVLDLGVYGMLLACILSLIAYDAVTLFMVGKLLKIQRSFFKVCLSPLIASALSGLLVYLINLLLVNLIGEILTLIICIVAFYGVYLLIMVFFMAIRPQELSKLPLGFLFNGFLRE